MLLFIVDDGNGAAYDHNDDDVPTCNPTSYAGCITVAATRCVLDGPYPATDLMRIEESDVQRVECDIVPVFRIQEVKSCSTVFSVHPRMVTDTAPVEGAFSGMDWLGVGTSWEKISVAVPTPSSACIDAAI
jgi:hypothetical protein